jgi:hypothetical protein
MAGIIDTSSTVTGYMLQGTTLRVLSSIGGRKMRTVDASGVVSQGVSRALISGTHKLDPRLDRLISVDISDDFKEVPSIFSALGFVKV